MKAHIGRKALGTSLLLALTFAGAFVARAATQGVPDCSIAGMADEYGLTLTTPSVSDPVAEDQLVRSVARDYPGASIADQQVATIDSKGLPTVDGRQGVVVLLAGVTPVGIGAPQGFQPGPIRARCVVSVYEALSGEFLVSLEDLEAAP